MRPVLTVTHILIILFLVLGVYARDQARKFEPTLQRLNNLSGEPFRTLIDSLYYALDQHPDYQTRIAVTKKVFRITAEKDDISHIRSLTYKVIYSDTNDPSLFAEASRLAEKHRLPGKIQYVEDRAIRFYMNRQQYDSAMVHVLRLLDMVPADLSNEGYRNALILLGDVYYHVRLYDMAGEIYLRLLDYYNDQRPWNIYHPYVLMNNMGQIEALNNSYETALQWFLKSRDIAIRELNTPDRLNMLTYINSWIAQIFIKKGNIEQATRYLDEAMAVSRQVLFEDVLQERVYSEALYAYQTGNYNKALSLAKTLEPGDTLLFNQYRYIPGIYRLLSIIQEAREENTLALAYMNKFARITDSLNTKGNRERSMVILAEREHDRINRELKVSRDRIAVLLAILVILGVVVVIILLLYRRIYLSKKALVQKALEIQSHSGQQNRRMDPADAKLSGLEAEEDPGFSDLIRKLQHLMETKQPYLNPQLTIQDTARLLQTNRTYLSQTVNRILKTTFPNYINDLRIQETIRLITSGYLVNHTQEALAGECGFANRSVFSAVFKKHTGVTPAFFAAHYKNGK